MLNCEQWYVRLKGGVCGWVAQLSIGQMGEAQTVRVAMCTASAIFSNVPDPKKGGATQPAKRAGSPSIYW